MLAQFRAFAKSPVANVLLGLILVSFLFVGGRSVLSAAGNSKDAVVRAGGRTVTSAQFRQMFQRALQRLSQQNNNQPVTTAEALKNDVDKRLLDEVSQEEALAAWISKIGVRPADKLIADELHKQPQLFNPVSGVFDKAAYQEILRSNGLTAPEFEAGLRDQIAQTHVLTGLVSGLQAPAVYSALEAVFRQEGRGFTWFALPASAVPPPPAPTEAELQAYLRDNAAGLMRPATRRVSLVRFSAALLAPTLTVDPAQVRKRYDFEKDALSTPEKRSFVQVAAASPAQAARLLKGLAAGEAPAAVAAAAKAPAPALHADQPRTAVPDAAVAAAVFAMRPGEVRQVQGSLGPAVVKLQGVTPGHDASFEEARPKLEAEVRRAQAVAKATELSQTYDDARNGGADLAEAARRAGVPVTPLPEFDVQGRDGRGQPVPVPPKLVQTAFGLPQGGTSEVLEAVPGQGEFYAIRVDGAKPSAPYTVDEVRGPLTRQLQLQALAKALKARADALVAEVKAGKPIAAVAAEAHAQAASAVVRRDQARQQPTFGEQLLGEVFAGKPGDVVLAPDPRGAGLLVARVDAVRLADPTEAGRAAQVLRRAATSSLYEDVAVNARSAAAALIRPRTDPVLARRAVTGDAAPAALAPR